MRIVNELIFVGIKGASSWGVSEGRLDRISLEGTEERHDGIDSLDSGEAVEAEQRVEDSRQSPLFPLATEFALTTIVRFSDLDLRDSPGLCRRPLHRFESSRLRRWPWPGSRLRQAVGALEELSGPLQARGIECSFDQR